MTSRFSIGYATLAGVALFGWWGAHAADLLPAGLAPVQRQWSHVAAELVLAAALLAGAWAVERDLAWGRSLLTAALGGLLYAAVNVVGDFTDSAAMSALLVLSAVLTVGAIAGVCHPVGGGPAE